VDKLRAQVGDFELTTLPGGFGPWFAAHRLEAPPDWKMALTVVLALYPTVMLLTLFPGPYTQPLGFAVAMLIGNAMSVCLLQWVVVPLLTRAIGPWLQANSPQQKAVSYGGLLLILAVLAILAFLFRLAKVGEP
jgi:antibiotic biosynthesis monooxygenase (ABM) superfamily enzyme